MSDEKDVSTESVNAGNAGEVVSAEQDMSPIEIARAAAALANSKAGGPLARHAEKVASVLRYLKVNKCSTDTLLTQYLAVKRRGFARQMEAAGLLESVIIAGRRVYGLSRLGAEFVGIPYPGLRRNLGNLEHSLMVQREIMIASGTLPRLGIHMQEGGFRTEVSIDHGYKRVDALLTTEREDFPLLALECERTRKSGLDMSRLVSFAGGIGRTMPLLIVCHDQRVFGHVLLHLYRAMDSGRVPVLNSPGQREPARVVLDKPVNPHEVFKNVYIKMAGAPWRLDKTQTLLTLWRYRQ